MIGLESDDRPCGGLLPGWLWGSCRKPPLGLIIAHSTSIALLGLLDAIAYGQVREA